MNTHTIIIDGIWSRPWRWEPLRALIERRLGSAEVWKYDSTGRITFDELGKRLVEKVRQHDVPVNLVGYSMGGLVARAAHLVDPEVPVCRAVFMNAPHEGSLLAYLLPLDGVRQMRPSSDFMKQVRADKWPIPSLCVYNPLDTMVVPGSSTRWTSATECVCCAIPVHLYPIWSKRLHERIAGFLSAAGESTS